MKDYLFSDCVYVDGSMYYYSAMYGFLEKWNFKSGGKAEYVYIPPKKYSVDRILHLNGVLYALDTMGSDLLMYSLATGEFSTFAIGCNNEPWGNYIDFFPYKEKIVIVPKYIDGILIFDTNVRVLTKYFNGLDKKMQGVLLGEEYWIFPSKGNEVISINLENGDLKSYITDIEIEKPPHCVAENNDIYILTRNNEIFVWNIDEKRMSLFAAVDSSDQLHRMMLSKSQMVLLPLHQKKDILLLDRIRKTSSIFEKNPEDLFFVADPRWSAFAGIEESENRIYAAMRSTNYMLYLDKQSDALGWIKANPVDESESFWIDFKRTGERIPVYEQTVDDLEGLIKNIVKTIS